VIEVEPECFEEMVAVTVQHRPGPPGLLGLYQCVPLTSRTTSYVGVLPDRITIYRQAILRGLPYRAGSRRPGPQDRHSHYSSVISQRD